MKLSSVKTFVLSAVAVLCLFATAPTLARGGLDETAQAAKLNKFDSVPKLAGSLVGTALSLIGVVFFILMIYGGLMWMTARGNEENTKKAFGTITAAVIGLLLVLASYAITRFVFSSVTGGEVSCAQTGSDPSCKGKAVGDLCYSTGQPGSTCQQSAPNRTTCSCTLPG